MSENQKIKNEVLKRLSKTLENLGFKLNGTSLIRETEVGLFQVFDISLGPATSIKHNFIGLGFGITTVEWLKNLNDYEIPKSINSSHCKIRDCYCHLVECNDDTVWYPISMGLEELFRKLTEYIIHSVIPFFEKMKTRDQIINQWKQYKFEIGLAKDRETLAMGTLLFLNNDLEGKTILLNLLTEKTNNKYFSETISKILNQNP